VLNVLTLVDECRRRNLPHLYLGYFVELGAMAYKAATSRASPATATAKCAPPR
jgi:arginyl-tRNA--protein-N-Asp/Glu arginylyltransferase